MKKDVVDQRAASSGASVAGLPASVEALPSANPDAGDSFRRRRKRQRNRDFPHRHPGNGTQFAVVTLVAIAVLFLILYALLPREEKITHDPQSSLPPRTTVPTRLPGSAALCLPGVLLV
jgi:hypothetical protein